MPQRIRRQNHLTKLKAHKIRDASPQVCFHFLTILWSVGLSKRCHVGETSDFGVGAMRLVRLEMENASEEIRSRMRISFEDCFHCW